MPDDESLGSELNPVDASSEASSEAPTPLAEKVRFWQEQDRINRALVPRLLAMHERLVQLGRTVEGASDRLAAVEAEVDAVREALDQTVTAADLARTVTTLEGRDDREAELRAEIEALRRSARLGRRVGMAALMVALVAVLLAALALGGVV